MPIIYLHLIIISIVTAIACVLPGTFLVLSGTALIADAISHAVLFGIVITFLCIHNIQSPLIFCGAVVSGILTVYLTEQLTQFRKINDDVAIALTFPFLFSVAVVLINLFANNVHLDIDAVLLGELAFAPFDTWRVGSYDLGPKALWTMSSILAINAACITFFYKELNIAIYDPHYAKQIGYKPRLFYYLIMTLTSMTIVQAFHVTGTMLVISFMVTPCATALQLTKKLHEMLPLTCLLAIVAVLAGFCIAHQINTSIAGAISCTNGLIFLLIMAWQKK